MKDQIIIRIKFNIPYHVFNDPFKEERLTKEWIDYRMQIFMKYTYQSLVNQINQEFVALLHYDPLSESLIRESLNEYPELQSNIIFTPDMNRSIEKHIEGYDHFFLTYLDSDNMFHPSMTQILHDIDTTHIQFVNNCAGYALDVRNGQMGYYNYYKPDTFYSLVYPVKQYLEGYRYPLPRNEYDEIMQRPRYVNELRSKTHTTPLFIITLHDKVMTHVMSRMLKMNTVHYIIEDEGEKQKILEEFKVLI